MIVGDRSTVAIESRIKSFHKRLSVRGIGSFLIHLANRPYGVQAEDATALACSFDAIEKRLPAPAEC